MKKYSLGVDIGNNWVKTALLKKDETGKVSVLNLEKRQIQLDKEALRLAEIINPILRNNKIEGKIDICVSLNTKEAILRNLSVPFKDKDKIQQALAFQLQPLILEPIEQLEWDFYIVEEKDKSADLLIGCLKKDFLNTIYRSLQDVDGEISVFTLDVFALVSFYLEKYPNTAKDRTVALVFYRKESILVGVIKNSRLIFLRDIPNTDDICKEIIFTLQVLGAESRKKTEEILILQEEENADFIRSLSKDSPVKVSVLEIEKNALAIGTALIDFRKESFDSINFIQRSSLSQKIMKIRKVFFSTIIISVLAVIFLLINFYSVLILKEYRFASLKKQSRKVFMEAFPEVKNIVNENAQMKAKVDEAKKVFNDLKDVASFSPLEILRELNIRIPTRFKVDVDHILIESGKLALYGRVNTPLAVKGLVRELDSSSHFSNIEIHKSQASKEGGVYFEISLQTR